MTETQRVEGSSRLEPLSEAECWERLAVSEVCRLAFLADGRIEIIPVNFAPRAGRLLFGSRPHSIVSRAVGGPVTVEVDSWTDRDAWSVVVRGPLLPVAEGDDRAAVDSWVLSDGEAARLELLPIEVQGRRLIRRAASGE